MTGRWTEAVVERVEKEPEKQKKVWCVKFSDTDFPEEEVAHEDDGEMALPEGGKFPKEVHFIDSATLDPCVLGRAVLKKVHKVKVEDKEHKHKKTVLDPLMGQMSADAMECGAECKLCTTEKVNEDVEQPE